MPWQRTTDVTDELRPIVGLGSEATTWEGATWVGELDERDLDGSRMPLAGAEAYGRARLLIWSDGQPRGFVEIPVTDGWIDAASVRSEVEQLPEVVAQPAPEHLPAFSVVACTRE